MRRVLKLFVIPETPPGAPPEPRESLEVEATGEDALRAAAHAAIEALGLRVRAVSFTESGLVGYAEELS
jgi:hypothetical protein